MAKTALLFPGQGAQKVGMGADLAETYPAARRAFEAARHELGFDLDRVCFDGPLEELSRSDVAQPAILTASVAVLEAMREAGLGSDAEAAAGLSLGEYGALVAAGALELPAAVRTVRLRGIYMQEACDANPGAMYSVLGLEDERVEEACEKARLKTGAGVWPANYNCPGQVVISGQEAAAERAAETCAEMGARRAVRLNVAGAFHTELMQPAAERLAADLADVEIRPPRFPVIANVTGRPVVDPDEVRRLLVEQVTSPVRWTDSMRWLAEQGVEAFFELGPGRVLQGLLKRIDPSRRCVSIGTADELQAWAGAGRA